MLQSRVVEVGGLWNGERGPSDFFLSKGMVVIYSHCKSSCKEVSTQIVFYNQKLPIFTQQSFCRKKFISSFRALRRGNLLGQPGFLPPSTALESTLFLNRCSLEPIFSQCDCVRRHTSLYTLHSRAM